VEDHFILFPVMIIVGLFYAVWYTILIVWFLLGLICKLLVCVYKNITNKSEVNNNDVVR